MADGIGGEWTSRARAKLRWLRAVDRARVEFGAAVHGYELRPVIDVAELESLEARNGYRFPAELRDFWTQLGGGGAGPDYGVLSPAQVQAFRPAEALTSFDDLLDRGMIREAATVMVREASGDPTYCRDTLERDVAAEYGSARLEFVERYLQARGWELPSGDECLDDHVEICGDDITGLIVVIEEGCGHSTCPPDTG